MFRDLSLLQKQSALVAGILLVELVLIVLLQVLINQSNQQTLRAERAFEINRQANLLVKEIADTGSALLIFALTRNEDFDRRYRSLTADLPERIKLLDRSAAEFPEDKEYMQKILAAADRWQTMFVKARMMMEQREHTYTQMTGLLNQEIKPHLQDLNIAISNFLDHHKEVEAAQNETRRRSQLLVSGMLITAGIFQIVLAIVSIVFFSRSITNRVAVLTDNVKRLARNEPLHSPVSGKDEISLLDANFHTMAQALSEAAAKERAIVDGMPAGFITISEEGMIQSANPRIVDMLQAQPDELINTELTRWLSTTDGKAVDFSFVRESASGHVCDFQVVRRDSSSFPAELSINVISSTNRNLLICNMLDVTERYAAERMRKEFVAIVSHDLRTPLQTILALMHILTNDTIATLTERGKTLVSKTEDETRRLVRLVNNLLDVARMEAGRIDLELGPAQIDKLVLDSFDAVARLAEQKRIKLQYQQCGLKCHVDPDRIMQVIVNLLSNAIKFAPEASQVDVRCQAIDEIAMVEVSVTDRGPGIPTSAQKKIFARFEQVTSSDRTQKGGTGLGLAICKMIVDAHHGTIDVISDPGKGSTFRFRLPAADGELPLPVMQPISQTNET